MSRWVEVKSTRWDAMLYNEAITEIADAIKNSSLKYGDSYYYKTDEILDQAYEWVDGVGFVPKVTVKEFWGIVLDNIDKEAIWCQSPKQ